MTYTGGGSSGSASCNTGITISSGIAYTFNSPVFVCTPSSSVCMPVYKWRVDGILVGTGATLVHTFTTGSHVIIITPFCGIDSCTPCAFKVQANGAQCKCGKWSGNSVSWSGGGVTGSIACNTGATISSGISYTFNSAVYVCTPSSSACQPVYKWRVDGILAGTGATLVHTFSTGSHLVTVTPFCGADSCTPCAFKIDAKPLVCSCGQWNGLVVNISGNGNTTTTFGSTITLISGILYTFTPPVYECNPKACPPSYLWNVSGGTGITSPTLSYTFNSPGTYSITITTICGANKCTGANFQVKIH
jgi:hypothetical protein